MLRVVLFCCGLAAGIRILKSQEDKILEVAKAQEEKLDLDESFESLTKKKKQGNISPVGLGSASAQDNEIPENWDAWLNRYGRNLGNRLGWFPGPDYDVKFRELLASDGERCMVTFIVDRSGKGLTLNLFATDVMTKLLSNEPLPKPGEKLGPKSKPWGQMLFESKCLSVGVGSDGIAHLHGVGTEWSKEYGGCHCMDRGKLLVQLADLLACKFGQTEIRGSDSSALACRSNPSVRAPMGLFYALKTGKSWYQSFGYEYTAGSMNMSEDITARGAAALNWAELGKSHQHLLDLYDEAFGKDAHQTATNFGFSLWVWDHHCADWESVVEVLFGASTLKGGLAGDMRKSLQCDAIIASSPLLAA